LKVALETLITNPAGLLNIDDIRNRSFGMAWAVIGTATSTDGPLKNFIPLQRDASGIVLDLGPGSGHQLQYFDAATVTMIIGAEPNEAMFPELKKAIEKEGLQQKYRLLPCGAEKESLDPALRVEGLLNGDICAIFDTIVCSKVLCSVPNQAATIDHLYELLKPGGTMIVNEHIRNRWESGKGSVFSRCVQVLFTSLGWTFLKGGCALGRDTTERIMAAARTDGGWAAAEYDFACSWGAIPFVIGRFVKKEKRV
jgi:SAM-dependent methyltransferase